MSRRLWIAVEAHLVSRDIVGHIADALEISRVAAVGHLVMMWGEAAEDARAGDVSHVRDSTLELWARWDGKPGAWAAFVREHCVTDGVLNGWAEMQGPLDARREHDSKRKRAQREREKESRGQSRESHADSHVTSRGTEQNRTEPKNTTPRVKKPAAAKVQTPRPKHWAQPLADAWEAKFGAGSFPWSKHVRALAAVGALDSGDADALGAAFARYLAETEDRFASLPAFLAKRLSYLQPQPAVDQDERDMKFALAHGGYWDTERGQLTDAGDLITNPDREQERARKVGAWRG